LNRQSKKILGETQNQPELGSDDQLPLHVLPSHEVPDGFVVVLFFSHKRFGVFCLVQDLILAQLTGFAQLGHQVLLGLLQLFFEIVLEVEVRELLEEGIDDSLAVRIYIHHQT